MFVSKYRKSMRIQTTRMIINGLLFDDSIRSVIIQRLCESNLQAESILLNFVFF
jgi:hypothetical protein